MRVGLKFHLFRTPLNEANISNIRFTKYKVYKEICLLSKIFYCFFKIFSDFALLISLGINSHNFGTREDILSVPK